MSGRHSKPSKASAKAAKVAVAGAGLVGGGLMMAATANAATDGEWDQVARCESGGNWAINTTGPSTPATGTRADCSSRPAPGSIAVAVSTPRPPTWPPRNSRSRSPRRCSRGRAAVPGRSADAACPVPLPVPLRRPTSPRPHTTRSSRSGPRAPRRGRRAVRGRGSRGSGHRRSSGP
ncbi:resuscitation-promoting factor RpfA [Mycobacteroides abscessus M94]|nr:resuscitation-promoting factor RpfA [Mycobacteroides abscessus M94]